MAPLFFRLMSAMPTPENNLPIDMRHDGLDPIQHD
jgi:hypothetical protein